MAVNTLPDEEEYFGAAVAANMDILIKASDLVRDAKLNPRFASDEFQRTWVEFEAAVKSRAASIRYPLR